MLEVTGKEGRGSQTPTSVDHYLGICAFHHRCAYVVVVSEERAAPAAFLHRLSRIRAPRVS